MKKNLITKGGLLIFCTLLLFSLWGCSPSASSDTGGAAKKDSQSEASSSKKKKTQEDSSSAKDGKGGLSGFFKKSDETGAATQDSSKKEKEATEKESASSPKEKPGGKKEYWSGNGLPDVKVKPWNGEPISMDEVYSETQDYSEYLFEHSGDILLTPLYFTDVSQQMARLGRNELYARHGYVFQDPALQSYFDNCSWYKRKPSYKGSLSKIEEANVFFFQAFEKYMSQEPGYAPPFSVDYSETATFYPINQIITADLDGDGKEEKICFYVASANFDGVVNCALKVNDAVVSLPLVEPAEVLALVDIDTKDDFLEIFIGDHGPSSDEWTIIFRYKNGKLIQLGDVPGMLGCSSVWGLFADGAGSLKAWMRLPFFMTWHAPYRYDLKNGVLSSPNSSGDVAVFAPLVLKEKLQLYPGKSFQGTPLSLPAGTPVVAIQTDQEQWIRLVAPGDKTGWFSCTDQINRSGKDAFVIFDNLAIYD